MNTFSDQSTSKLKDSGVDPAQLLAFFKLLESMAPMVSTLISYVVALFNHHNSEAAK